MVLPPVPEDLVKSHGALGHCANQEFIAAQLQTFLSLSTQLVPLKFDHADCISPVPPGQLCQQSALAGGCKAGLEEPCPSATVLSSMWQQAQQCMRRPVNPYSSAVGYLEPISSSPEQQAALALEAGTLWQDFSHRSGCSFHSFPSSAPHHKFLHYLSRAAVSVAATTFPQKSEAQTRGGSVSKCLSSFLIHFAFNICYLCIPWNSVLSHLIVNYHLPNE